MRLSPSTLSRKLERNQAKGKQAVNSAGRNNPEPRDQVQVKGHEPLSINEQNGSINEQRARTSVYGIKESETERQQNTFDQSTSPIGVANTMGAETTEGGN